MRFLIVDDHALFSAGMKFLLEDLDSALDVECATSINDALQISGPFDFVLLDYSMPDCSGTSGLEQILNGHEGAMVVMLSGESDPDLIHELVEAGASGFVQKTADRRTLMEALSTILAGGIYLPPMSLTPPKPSVELTNAVASLTERQVECMMRAAQGKSNKMIARELEVSEGTVKAALSVAFKAIGVDSRWKLLEKVFELGLKSPVT